MASVTTSFAKSLFAENDNLKIITKKLDKGNFKKLIKENEIKLVIDATHPFAVEASKNVINAVKTTGTDYIRFERENFSVEYNYKNLVKVLSYEKAIEKLLAIKGNIFCTTGSKYLHKITKHIEVNRIFPRILPLSEMVKKCEDLGIPNQNIIAMKGPFSNILNAEIMRSINATVLVTKESGETGGTLEKLEAAKILNIPVVMIEREKIVYPQLVNKMEELKKYIEVEK